MDNDIKPIIPGGTLAALWELFRTMDERRALERGSAPDDEDEDFNPALSKDAYP